MCLFSQVRPLGEESRNLQKVNNFIVNSTVERLLEAPPLSTVVKLAPSPESILAATKANSATIERGSGEIKDGRGYRQDGTGSGYGNTPGKGTGGGGSGKVLEI